MNKLLVIILIIVALFLVIYAANWALNSGKKDMEQTTEKMNKAADENVKNLDDPHRPKDRGYGSEMKKRAYDNTKKALETPGRQLDKIEKNSEPSGGGGGGGEGGGGN